MQIYIPIDLLLFGGGVAWLFAAFGVGCWLGAGKVLLGILVREYRRRKALRMQEVCDGCV